MSLTSNFQNMLNEYAPDSMFSTELFKRDYILSRCKKDDKWECGDNSSENAYIVPFKAGRASSARFGAYTDAAEIAQMKTIRGKIQNAKLLTGTLQFFEADIMRHGKLSAQNMMDSLLDQLPDMMDYLKNIVSTSFVTGNDFALITNVDDIATGVITVDRPDRFEIGQLVEIFHGNTAIWADNAGAGGSSGNELYVIAIDINLKTVTLSLTRSGTAATLSGILVDDGCRYHDSYLSGNQSFQSLRKVLLSAANGGDATYLGYSKVLYPYLQAFNYDGSAMSTTNMLKKIFEFAVQAKTYTQAKPTEVLMSLKNWGICSGIVESQKGAFKVDSGSESASEYGWNKITVGSMGEGTKLTLVGVNEFGDDLMIAPSFDNIVFASNGGLKKVVGMNGNNFFETRGTTGRSAIQDVRMWGELIVKKPCSNAIIHSIPKTLAIA